MSDRTVILALARVIVAAAWADGKLAPEELDSLKDLLFRLPHVGPARGVELPAADWQALELYMQSPVSAAERARLVEELKAALRTPADRTLAYEALDALAASDGATPPEEQAAVAEIRSALQTVDLGLLARFGRFLRGPLERRTTAAAGAAGREAELEDFVKNRIYYDVRRRLGAEETGTPPEATLRTLSLAAGLLARVAHVDEAVTSAETSAMVVALRDGWGLAEATAAAVADVAVSAVADGLDYFRLTRSFFEATDDDQRTQFLDVLFGVARADGAISPEETGEIRRIARSLNLSQQVVNDALDRARAG
jgi:uncharacterized tellurite resistance protein B-like protein